eukprot:g5748.t1
MNEIPFVLDFLNRDGINYGGDISGDLRKAAAGTPVKLAIDTNKLQRYFVRRTDSLCGGQVGKFVQEVQNFVAKKLLSVELCSFVFVFDGIIVPEGDAAASRAASTAKNVLEKRVTQFSSLWENEGRNSLNLCSDREPKFVWNMLEGAMVQALRLVRSNLDSMDTNRLAVRRYYNRILNGKQKKMSRDFKPCVPPYFPFAEEYQRFEVSSAVAAAWADSPILLSGIAEPTASCAASAFAPLRALEYALSLGCNPKNHGPLSLKSEHVTEIRRTEAGSRTFQKKALEILDHIDDENMELLNKAMGTMDFWTVTIQDRQRGIITPEQAAEIQAFKELWEEHNATIRQRSRGRMGRNAKLQVEELRMHQRNITNKILSIKKGYESPYNKARKKLLLALLRCDQPPVITLANDDGELCIYALATRSLMRLHAGVAPSDIGSPEEKTLQLNDKISGGEILRSSAMGGRLDALLLSACIVRHMSLAEREASFPGYKVLAKKVSASSETNETFFPSEVVDMQLLHLTGCFQRAVQHIANLNGVLKKPLAVQSFSISGNFELWDGVLTQCVYRQLRAAGQNGKTWLRLTWKAPLSLRQQILADLDNLMPAVDPVCPRVIAAWSTALGDIRKKTVVAPTVPDQKQKLKTINWLRGWAESLGVGAIRATVFQTANQTDWIELDSMRKNQKLKEFPEIFEELSKKHFKKTSGKAFMKVFNEKVRLVAENAKQQKAAEGARQRAKLEEPKRRAAVRKEQSKELEALLDRGLGKKVGHVVERADDLQRRVEVLRDGERSGAVSGAAGGIGEGVEKMDQRLLRRALRALVELRIACVTDAELLLKAPAKAKLSLALRDFVKFILDAVDSNTKVQNSDIDLIRSACKSLRFEDIQQLLSELDQDLRPLCTDAGEGTDGVLFREFAFEELHKHLELDPEPSTKEQDEARAHFNQLPFTPNNFQVGMLNGVRRGHSVIATAPTTYGKSFGVLYAAGYTVASTTDDTVVAIVCPTQSLCDQTQAELYGRMKNIKTRPGVTLLGTATPYIELDVCTSRVLVATPDKLEQLLLQGWPSYTDTAERRHERKLAYVIIDEFHACASQYGRLLSLLDCPFVLLSATIGNSAQLQKQLERLQDVKMKQGWNKASLDAVESYARDQEKERKRALKKDKKSVDNGKEIVVEKPRVILVPDADTLLRRPVDLLWWHITPPKVNDIEASVASIKPERNALRQMHRLTSEEGRVGASFQHLPALEALQLWRAMHPNQPPPMFDREDPPSRNPRHRVASVVPSKSMIWKRCDDFRDEFAKMSPKQQDTTMESLMSSIATSEKMKGVELAVDFYEQAVSTIFQLHAQKYLPAVCFHLESTVCRKLLESTLARLESWEDHYKESDEWKQKLKLNEEAEKKNKKLANKKQKEKEADNAYDAEDMAQMGSAAVLDLTAPLPKFCLQRTGVKAIETWVDKLCWKRRNSTSWTKDHFLIRALRRGIGFHCMTEECPEGEKNQYQRYLNSVEDLFRQKALVVVFSTRSLSLGINMPVRSVVLAGDHPLLTPTVAAQMAGRSGRRGLDVEGHVFLCNMSLKRANELQASPVTDVDASNSIDEDFLQMARKLGGNKNYDRAKLLKDCCSFYGGDDTFNPDLEDEEEEELLPAQKVEEKANGKKKNGKSEVVANGKSEVVEEDESDDDWDAGSDSDVGGRPENDDDSDAMSDWDA